MLYWSLQENFMSQFLVASTNTKYSRYDAGETLTTKLQYNRLLINDYFSLQLKIMNWTACGFNKVIPRITRSN